MEVNGIISGESHLSKYVQTFSCSFEFLVRRSSGDHGFCSSNPSEVVPSRFSCQERLERKEKMLERVKREKQEITLLRVTPPQWSLWQDTCARMHCIMIRSNVYSICW